MNSKLSNENKITEILIEFRKEKGLTQQELANNVNYSIRQIKRSESMSSVVSADFIKALSDYYNVNLEEIIYILVKFGSIDAYNKYEKIRKYIENRNMKKIKVNANIARNMEEFAKGICRKLICYCDALLYVTENGDYNKSNNSCFDGLSVSNIVECLELLRTRVLDEMDYPLVFQVAHNCKFNGNIEFFHEITKELNSNLEQQFSVGKFSVVSRDYYIVKYYILSIYDMSYSAYKLDSYEKSLMYIVKAIDITHEFRNYTLTPFLYELKFRIHYNLGNISEAKKSLVLFENSCTIFGMSDYFKSNIQKISKKYCKLFE